MPDQVAIGDTVDLVTKVNNIINNVLTTVAVTTAINPSEGDYFTKSMSTNTTFTFGTWPADPQPIFLRLTVTGGATPTWPASVVWEEGITPTFTSGKTHLILFITEDSGTTVRGIARLNFAS